jgi:hypothetical protein
VAARELCGVKGVRTQFPNRDREKREFCRETSRAHGPTWSREVVPTRSREVAPTRLREVVFIHGSSAEGRG